MLTLRVDSETFESTLCNQDVVARLVYTSLRNDHRLADVSSYELRNVTLRKHVDAVDKAKEITRSLFSKKKPDQENDTNVFGPATLQLLTEDTEMFTRVIRQDSFLD